MRGKGYGGKNCYVVGNRGRTGYVAVDDGLAGKKREGSVCDEGRG